MNIGFTGTRDGMSEAQYRWTKRIFHQCLTMTENTLHHGCCVGADSQAHTIACLIRSDGMIPIAIIGHPPTYTKWRAHLQGIDCERKPKLYLERNHNIVDECDLLIACPKGPEILKSGTWATVRYARRSGKPITIIWRNGAITEER